MSRERPSAGPLRLWLFVVSGILVLGLGVVWLRSGAKPEVPGSDEAGRGGLHPEETPPGHGAKTDPQPAAKRAKRAAANVPTSGDDDELVWVDPATLTPEQIAERRAKRLRMAAQGRRDYYRYPPNSRPLSENEDLLVRDHVEPEIRKLKQGEDGEKGAVRLELWQNKMFLREGDMAAFRVKASTEKGPVPINVIEARLVTFPDEGTAAQNLGPIDVLDDGSPPDEISGDGVPSGGFVASESRLGSYRGNLRVRLSLESEGEQGTATFQFVYTGAEPGRFTGEVSEAVEDGSLALYFGLELDEAGRYEVQARLYDKSDRPIALLTFNQDLEAGAQKARLLAFGKLLHDEGAEGPFTIRDIEGWRLLSGTYPDRQMMKPPADYTTKVYGLDQFSDAEYRDPQAEAMIEHIESQARAPAPPPSN